LNSLSLSPSLFQNIGFVEMTERQDGWMDGKSKTAHSIAIGERSARNDCVHLLGNHFGRSGISSLEGSVEELEKDENHPKDVKENDNQRGDGKIQQTHCTIRKRRWNWIEEGSSLLFAACQSVVDPKQHRKGKR